MNNPWYAHEKGALWTPKADEAELGNMNVCLTASLEQPCPLSPESNNQQQNNIPEKEAQNGPIEVGTPANTRLARGGKQHKERRHNATAGF